MIKFFIGILLFMGLLPFNMKIFASPLPYITSEKTIQLASNNGKEEKKYKEKIGKASRKEGFDGKSRRKKAKDGKASRT